jgi:16S rRNA (guanine966-N2)-methyltransferase
VRPTGDRVREALFSMLDSRQAVAGADVLDLFAGSGALGIEALSRGAAGVTFVDHDQRALDVVRANLEATGFADHPGVTVVRADAQRYLASAAAVDLALLDPPYAFTEWPALLAALPAALVVVESNAPPELPDGWALLAEKRYGATLVTLASPSAPLRPRPAS